MRNKIILMLVCLTITAFAQPLFSADSLGTLKRIFLTTEDVYAYGLITIGPPNWELNLYVVYDSNNWNVGDKLTDVSGGAEFIRLDWQGHVTLTRVWTHPLFVGSFDLVADMNRNGILDNGDVVWSEQDAGFTVVVPPPPPQPTGGAVVAPGFNTPGSHGWYYDPNGDPYNEMLQIMFGVNNTEAVRVDSITLKASGTGNDVTGISSVFLAVDSNANGIYDSGESVLTSGTYSQDNGYLTMLIPNGYIVQAGQTVHFLIVYVMSSSPLVGDTFLVQVTAISATGLSSGNQITITGLPITSGIKTTVQGPQPQCTGTIVLTLNPNPVNISQTVTASLSGLQGCSGKTAYVRALSCSGTIKCSAVISGSGGSCTFTSPEIDGSYTYFACIDKDENGQTTESGERAYVTLTVVPPIITNPPAQNQTPGQQGNQTGNQTGNGTGGQQGGAGGTGAVDLTPYIIIAAAILIAALIIAISVLLRRPGKEKRRR